MARSPEALSNQEPNFAEPNAMGLTPKKKIDPSDAQIDPNILESDLQILEEWKKEAIEWEQDHMSAITLLQFSPFERRED